MTKLFADEEFSLDDSTLSLFCVNHPERAGKYYTEFDVTVCSECAEELGNESQDEYEAG